MSPETYRFHPRECMVLPSTIIEVQKKAQERIRQVIMSDDVGTIDTELKMKNEPYAIYSTIREDKALRERIQKLQSNERYQLALSGIL